MTAASTAATPNALAACGGCGTEQPAARTPDYVPAEYRPYMRDGKVQPTGHPALDYWVYVNVVLTVLKGPQTALTLPSALRSLAEVIREKPTAGVDPDVVRWADGVAGVPATKADILDRLNDPGTLRRAKEEVAAGPTRSTPSTGSPWTGSGTGWSPRGRRCGRPCPVATAAGFPSPAPTLPAPSGGATSR